MFNTIRRTGLVISLAGFAISVNTLPALVTWFSLRFSVPVANFGIIFLLQYGAFSACSMVVGRLHASRRLPLLGIVIGSLAVSSMCLFWIGVLPSYQFLVVVMILIGGAGGLVESIGTTLITTSNGSNRMLYTSQFFYALGAFLAPMLVGFLLNLGVSVPNIGRLIGIFSLAIGTVVWLLVYQPWMSPSQIEQATVKNGESPLVEADFLAEGESASVEIETSYSEQKTSSTRLEAFAFLLIFLTMISYVFIESAVGNWLAVYVNDALAFTRAEASFALSLYWVGLGSSRMLYMVVLIKNQPRTLLIHMGMMLAGAVLLLVPDSGSGIGLLLGAIFLLGLGCGPVWPLLIEYCSHIFAREHLLMYLVGAGSIGALLGPIVTSTLFSIIGLERMNMLFFAYVLVMLFTAVVTLRITRHNHMNIA